MWQLIISSALIFTSFCVAAPQQNEELDPQLIATVFQQNGATGSNVAAVPKVGGEDPGSIGGLVNQVFNTNKNGQNNLNNGNSDSGKTILGVNNQNTAKPDDCECVKYYQCQNGTILEDGVGIIDIRLSGPCPDYLDACCKAPNIRKPEDKITPPPVVRKGCGQRHADGVGFRITGDKNNEAQFGEFPWMVAILRAEIINKQGGERQVLNVYQCGGALIHPQAILTAAHCVSGKKPTELKIRAGEWDTQTNAEIYPHQDRDVSKIIIHEQFHAGSLRNDYAILILSTPIDYAENVDIVCLPELNEQFDFARCVATGWGKDIFGQSGHYQVILKKVDLPVVPHNSCQNSLRTTRLGTHFVLNNSFICAGGEVGLDTCKGDGGSPLVCPSRNDPTRYVQAGIVAWGIGCGEAGIPGVYANVAAARRWIDEKMAFNNLDTFVYTL